MTVSLPAVGITSLVDCEQFTWSFGWQRYSPFLPPNLVDVHVCRSARAALNCVGDEPRVQLTFQRFVAGCGDGVAHPVVQQSRFTVGQRRSFLDADNVAVEPLVHRISRDVEERGRDLNGIIKQYLNTVKPMHYLYVEPTRSKADIVINSGKNDVAFDLFVSKISMELEKRKQG